MEDKTNVWGAWNSLMDPPTPYFTTDLGSDQACTVSRQADFLLPKP